MASYHPSSERLSYRRLTAANVDGFHRLVIDSPVKRYLLDGETMPREWSEKEIRSSQCLFHEWGVGIRLVFERGRDDTPVGFCGFIAFCKERGREPPALACRTFPPPHLCYIERLTVGQFSGSDVPSPVHLQSVCSIR